MELNSDLKKQLMTLTGVSDPKEFESLLKEMTPAIEKAQQEAVDENNKAVVDANKNCPFQIHFVRMVGYIDAAGMDKLNKLNDDIEAQIQYVFNVLETADKCKNLDDLVKKSKVTDYHSTENSNSLRARGNKCYEKKNLDSALEVYCEAILVAIIDSNGQSREASLGLGNRSAVFFERNQIDKCLHDIEAAFFFGYPNELRYKLYERSAKCYLILKKLDKAKESLQNTLNSIENSNLNGKKKEDFVMEINDMMKNIGKQQDFRVSNKTYKNKEFQCPFTIWNKHKNFPSLCDSLDIVYTDNLGRHVVALNDIRAGEAIVVEEPIAFHLSPYKMSTNCLHCFKRYSNQVLPSPWNKKARFCNLECLKLACSTYHKTESNFDINEIFYGDEFGESQLSGCISLAYRAFTQKSLDFFKTNKETLFENYDIEYGTKISKDFNYCGDELYRGLFNLVNHMDKITSQDRVTFLIRTFVLLKSLKKSGYFPQQSMCGNNNRKLTPDELFIGRLLFHFQSGIKYNLHTVYQIEGKMDGTKKIPIKDIGSGVYPTTLYFNHSCCPNTVRVNMGPKVAYVAKRNIKAGEEVTDCYGIHHLNMDIKERQKTLRNGYSFNCCCQGCQQKLPLLQDLPTEITPFIARKIGPMLSKYKELFAKGKFESGLKICQDYLSKLEELKVVFPHRNYEIASTALCTSLWAMVQNY